MLNLDKIVDLPVDKVETLKKIITDRREHLRAEGLYINDIVREDIFGILDHYCTVVYFPLPRDEENDGFHVTMPVDYKPDGDTEHFVFLNTRKPIEKQVFAAAHELGHIWVPVDCFWDEGLEAILPQTPDNLDAIMNRFAAELLIPSDWFQKSAKEQLDRYTRQGKIFITDVIRVVASLMNQFCVPAQAVICRFYETQLMRKEVCQSLLTGPDDWDTHEYEVFFKSTLEKCLVEGGYTMLLQSSEKKGIKDFPEVLNKMEEKRLFSEQKINRLRDKLGIPKINDEKTEIEIEDT